MTTRRMVICATCHKYKAKGVDVWARCVSCGKYVCTSCENNMTKLCANCEPDIESDTDER